MVTARFLRCSEVKCLTRNPGVPGSSRTEFSGFFFRGSVLGQDTSEPRRPTTGEPQERHE